MDCSQQVQDRIDYQGNGHVKQEKNVEDFPTTPVSSRSTQPGRSKNFWASEETLSRSRRSLNPWSPENRKLILLCGLTVGPLLIFTVAMLALVFANELRSATCPYPQLCPRSGQLNGTTTASNYYVDYPAARLAFISSWSSTVSFSLVGFLMTMYSYIVARQMLLCTDVEGKMRHLPSPYQTSILTRVLNAEILALYDLVVPKTIQVLLGAKSSVKKAKDGHDKGMPRVLSSTIAMFLLAMFGSFLIQAADTYLHIATESVNALRIEPVYAPNYQFSKGLADWCLERETVGSSDNVNYWGCGMHYDEDREYVWAANMTTWWAIRQQVSKDHAIFNFTDSQGVQYAIIGPNPTDSRLDWKASSFAVSTQCSAIASDACTIFPQNETNYWGEDLVPFECTQDRAGVEMSGNISSSVLQYHFFDWHKYLDETGLFDDPLIEMNDTGLAVARNVTDDEANDMFNNPWHWSSASEVFSYDSDPLRNSDDGRIWKLNVTDPFMVFDCRTTIWDVTYTVVDQVVESMEAQKSNGSITGIASMPSAYTWDVLTDFTQGAVAEANLGITSPDDYLHNYQLATSKMFALPLASQLDNQPALLVQHRNTKVVTQLPKAALWVLVVANLMFAFLGLSLTVFGLLITSMDVHQVQVRLGMAGLAAELFEKTYAERKVNDDTDLFEEHAKEDDVIIKRVGVKRTDTGGTVFSLTR